MSDKEINIAMAKACGWEVRPYSDMLVWYNPKGHACPVERGHRNKCLPNYVNDLNVMHEAEKVMNSEQWVAYGKELSRLDVFPMVHATARQRAEAFLRTLGKWEETK